MGESYFLSIDFGTSSMKVILYDSLFNNVSSISYEMKTIHPKAIWAEQDQNLWYQNATTAIKGIIAKTGIASTNIKSMGMCGEMHGPTLVDKKGRPFMRCIIWPDLRATSQAEAINKFYGSNRVSAHYTAAKLLWIKENYPEILDKAYKFLVPTDFLRTRFTGDFCTDATNAGGTNLFNRQKMEWDWDLTDHIGLRHDLFPTIRETGEFSGQVTEDAARDSGLSEGTPVITGGGDAPVTNMLLSQLEARNCLLIYLGTAPITRIVTKEGKSMPMGTMSAGGGAGLKWFNEQFCLLETELSKKTNGSPYDLMNQEMSRIEPGSDGLVFIPHMMGERTPYNDYARGVYFGLSLGHTREHMMRALVEGITFQLRSYWEVAKEKEGIEPDYIIVYGGGSKSRFWRQFIADVFGYAVYKLKFDDLSPLHLAVMSAVASGYYKNVQEAYRKVDLSLVERLEPSRNQKDKLDRAYNLFKNVDKALQGLYTPEHVIF